MGRVLLTGMSATGTTTVLAELARRGHRTVDTDDAESQRVLRDRADVEPLLRASATVELDSRRPVAEVADAVERLAGR